MKTMLITGGGRGIGAATALLAARHGFNMVINYHRQQAAAEQVVARINESGGTAVAIRADISKESEIINLFNETDRLFGNLYSLVNNAAVLYKQTSVENIDTARLIRMFTVNSIAPFICSREAVKRMSCKYGGTGGSIINVSSMAAISGSPHEYVDYAASKAALDTLTIGLSKEVASEGIRVNAVRPAFIYTGIHAGAGEPDRIQKNKNLIPMNRGGNAAEVAEAIVWLASEKASYTTGGFINVSGGF